MRPAVKKAVLFLRKLAYWLLPVIILAAIFRQIDIGLFLKVFTRIDPGLFIAGLMLFPAGILLGALRWRAAVSMYLRQHVPYLFILKHYYVGLAIGFFIPASVGWDVYRIIAAGSKFGRFGMNVAAVLAEKLFALLAIMALIVALHPFVQSSFVGGGAFLENIRTVAALALLMGCAILIVAMRLRRTPLVAALSRYLERLLARVAGLVRRGGRGQSSSVPVKLTLGDLVEPLVRSRHSFHLLALSVLIQMTAAFAGVLIFLSLGCHAVTFTANIFLVAIISFIFAMPFSFGSLGIREGIFVLLYAQVGVSAEVALAASFLNLAGLLLNEGIGAVLIWTTGRAIRPTVGAIASGPDSVAMRTHE